MEVKILSEYGEAEALFGLGLSFGKTSGMVFGYFKGVFARPLMKERAHKLAGLGRGHDKFLRMLMVTLDITAPLYWWKQFDTYKVGTVAQSESTMHTLMKKPLTPDMFEGKVIGKALCWVYNRARKREAFDFLNTVLPQSFLQRRIVQTNYAALRNMLEQRASHKLPEWEMFCDAVREQAKNSWWLTQKTHLQSKEKCL